MNTTQIGNITFTANKTARSVEAVQAIAKAKADIEARGYVIDTKGPAAGSCGRFKVYIYPFALIHEHGERNSAATASHVFEVTYVKGKWFASPTAVAESMAKGLTGFAKHLEEEDAHAALISQFARESMVSLRTYLCLAMAEYPGAHVEI